MLMRLLFDIPPANRQTDECDCRWICPDFRILHDQREARKEAAPTFALDLMEPLRPVVDRAVLKLIAEETFSGADFQLQSDGVCRLNPELARRVSMSASAFTGTLRGLIGVGND